MRRIPLSLISQHSTHPPALFILPSSLFPPPRYVISRPLVATFPLPSLLKKHSFSFLTLSICHALSFSSFFHSYRSVVLNLLSFHLPIFGYLLLICRTPSLRLGIRFLKLEHIFTNSPLVNIEMTFPPFKPSKGHASGPEETVSDRPKLRSFCLPII